MSHIVDAHIAYIKTISDLNQDKAELLERIKRLEDRIKRLEDAGDELLFWIPAEWVSDSNHRLLSNSWNKAKEAKP